MHCSRLNETGKSCLACWPLWGQNIIFLFFLLSSLKQISVLPTSVGRVTCKAEGDFLTEEHVSCSSLLLKAFSLL